MSLRWNFCRSVPPEFLRSFFSFSPVCRVIFDWPFSTVYFFQIACNSGKLDWLLRWPCQLIVSGFCSNRVVTGPFIRLLPLTRIRPLSYYRHTVTICTHWSFIAGSESELVWGKVVMGICKATSDLVVGEVYCSCTSASSTPLRAFLWSTPEIFCISVILASFEAPQTRIWLGQKKWGQYRRKTAMRPWGGCNAIILSPP